MHSKLQCIRCFETKPTTEFHKARTRVRGFSGWCKNCAAEHHKLSWPERRDRQRPLRQQRRRTSRAFVENVLAESECADCGEKDIIVLTFDHVSGTKRDNVTSLGQRGFSLQTIKAEMEKCDIVCMNCHMRREAKRGGWSRAKKTRV